MVLRTISVTHTDAIAVGDLVQEAVATAQLTGWVVQAVVPRSSESLYTYEIETYRLQALKPLPTAVAA
ncbi:hypothetical protein EON81_25345 [bacterium]|nr:MAG: hypothetical protein EON81_25345 [bacterium]